MKACIIGWLLLALSLAALSALVGPYLDICTEDDNAFAHEYAGEMAAVLEQMPQAAAAASDDEFYWTGEADFRRRKEAAVHMKWPIAVDFVYAFDQAEAWCRWAGRDAGRAAAALARARAEFTAIRAKDYRQSGR